MTRYAVLGALLFGAPLLAHEIGTTRVSVIFHQPRTYDVEIVTDAEALGEKLAVLSGGAPPTRGEFAEVFLKRVHMTFDGTEVRPSISYVVSAPTASIRLTGEIPASARSFTWNYAWTFASYALTIRHDGTGQPATRWLEGGETSAPFELSAPITPVDRMRTAWRYLTLGFTHILPYGLDHMLFVLGIYLLSGHARSVLMQVSAFTVAHSITLGLSMYGLVTVPAR